MKNITKVRKQVATIANRINRKIKDLSAAFKRAWQIVKGRVLVSKVSGVTFGNRQAALRKLDRLDTSSVNVSLEREQGNPHDTDAVKVNVSVGNGKGYHLGYVPRELASLIAPLLDKGIGLIARFKGVTGGYYEDMHHGALITVEM